MNEDFYDFYGLLGVAFEANSDDVKTAFRYMAKRYHPDLNPDDSEQSTIRFHMVQNAYEVLTDPLRRCEYDQRWKRAKNIQDPFDNSAAISQTPDSDWEFACRYYPHLVEQSERLKKFSGTIEQRWRNLIFFEKSFNNASDLARSTEEAFLGKLVGASDVLRMVARDAILVSHDALLSELTTALRVFGPDTTEKIISEICESVICIDDNNEFDEPIRLEKFRGKDIKVMDKLVCYVDFGSRAFTYVFSARAAIDSFVDRNVPIERSVPVTQARRRRS